ncbi:MAG: hypothetical protein EVA88_02095 [Rhodospirillaceae bacterium]|nr:MAG: hypothetical protein EVA88_02095 [Rhodospirillaceae bacterium]
MSSVQKNTLRVAAIRWLLWGLVHVLAGVMVLMNDATGGLQAVADGVNPAALAADYHGAVEGVLNQHGWNLGWFGVATIIGAAMIWRQNRTAIWVTSMVGGLADIGYLLFLDFAGYVNFVPGTVMTFISGAAVLLSFWVWFSTRSQGKVA